ncbi:hypothetical protein SAMN05192555_10557 [Franzmannia pantelleriensis]|uniref:Uncharacterized protein n=1 Tax=Franzmannia pantelleriensis TaxID=48727 RepID=A0A1G9KU23_9GAMM|nr:hypothetical protein [Halomonas pantelleriensis]SDL53084.1 hypothetical protein SAMN05192555_10557 [Halomonas pantelleriensis]
MSSELTDFEQRMQQEIENFLKPDAEQPTPTKRAERPVKLDKQDAKSMKTGHIVRLAVRTKQLEMDTAFEYHSTSISKLEAQMEAEKAARKAGYPIVGYVIDIQRL